MTCDTWHVTRDMQHVTRDKWHVTCDMLLGGNIISKFQLPSSSINYKGVCRTAPATPGLLTRVVVGWQMTCDKCNMTHDTYHLKKRSNLLPAHIERYSGLRYSEFSPLLAELELNQELSPVPKVWKIIMYTRQDVRCLGIIVYWYKSQSLQGYFV